MRWNCKRSIFKNHRNCSPLRLGVRSRQKQVRRVCNPLLKLNVLNRLPPWSSLGEQFLRFSKKSLTGFHRIFLIFDRRTSCVFQIFLRSVKAYLFQILILTAWILVSIALKKWCLFWRSVYNTKIIQSLHTRKQGKNDCTDESVFLY